MPRSDATVQPSLNILTARLRVRHFSLLDALGTTRNLRGAAHRLHITQPGASKLLAEIESLFGAKLFERTRRGVLPTSIGDIAITRSRRILAEIERIREEFEATAAGVSGVVRIGAFALATAVLVPRTVQRLARASPNLTCILQEAPPNVLLNGLRQGELDFVVGRIPAGEADIVSDVLYDQPVCVVAGRGHSLARHRRVTWAMAARADWILPPHGGAARVALEATLARVGERLPHAHIETISLIGIEALVEQGRLALMPFDVAKRLSDRGQIEILPLKLEVALPPIGVAWEAARRITPVMNTFLQALRTEAAVLVSASKTRRNRMRACKTMPHSP